MNNNSRNEKLVLVAFKGGYVALVPEREIASILDAERDS